ncbi:MAG: ribonuclease J [Lachnospiraceae bacterium]|nr:ribonuclease J [Lachnospiraceae bacterium]
MGLTNRIRVIPLGGLEQIGMNITAFCYGESIVVVDCGLAFPEDDMLGIDLVIPDVTYLKEHADQVKGFFITHGHEDHIGALPYILRELPVPVYGTKLTLAIIRNKLEEYKMADEVSLNVVSYGDVVTCDDISVEFIRTNHSVADAAALAIRCEAGTIIHTGDFKVDFTPVYGEPIDLQRLGEIGKQGVLALMCDSTNALKPGHTMSERSVGKTFDNIFAENTNRRIIVATFASNVDRVQQIINSAQKYGRKVAIEGRSMVNIVTTAQELGYIKIPDGLLIPLEEVKNYPDNQLALIMTGSQGEPMAALSRIASNTHKRVSIMPGDVVIISSTPIPGNEKAVSKLINVLSMLGANVIFQDTHVSGHANQDEIKLLYCLLKPKYSIPIHGEYRHRIAQKHIAEGLGMASDHIIILKSGDMLDIGYDGASLAGSVPAHGIMVDGLGICDVGNAVLRDRQYLSVNGIVIVSVAIDPEIGEIISGPDIVTRGFVYVKESERLLEEAREVVLETCNRFTDFERLDTNRLRAEIKSVLGDFFWKSMKRSPMILPVILELDA